jgi:hypothetical protein
MTMTDTSDEYYVGHCPLSEIYVRNIMLWETFPFLSSGEMLLIECIAVDCNMILASSNCPYDGTKRSKRNSRVTEAMTKK